jgi:hypothetical protein
MRFKARVLDIDGRMIECEIELPDDSMLGRLIQESKVRNVSIVQRDGLIAIDPWDGPAVPE